MNKQLPKEVQEILNKVSQAGFQIYIVGGAVRDLLMDRSVNDWDFTTDAKPEEILKIFPEGFYDNKFGTVGVHRDVILGRSPGQPTPESNNEGSWTSQDDKQNDSSQTRMLESNIFEITTMRKEGVYQDFRHPVEVSWTDKIEEDLARRDFTINALALGPKSNSVIAILSLSKEKPASPRGEQSLDDNFILIDPFKGQEDLQNKTVRAVGDPQKRFQEDALRLMRAIRISTELGFEIEKKTWAAIKESAQLIKEVSFERIRDELFKILASANFYEGIAKLREGGILSIILPELEKTFGVSQEGPKHARVYDIGEHSLLTLQNTPSQDPLVRLAALLHDIGKPSTVRIEENGNVTFYNHDFVGGKLALQIAQRFHLSKKQTDKFYRLIRWHLFTVDEKQTDAAIRRFIKNVGVENIEDMMAIRVGDRIGGGTQKAISWRMEKFSERIKQVLHKPFSISDLKVNGQDVMEILNIPPGPKVGEILNKLFEEVLEDASKNTREYLLEKIKQLK